MLQRTVLLALCLCSLAQGRAQLVAERAPVVARELELLTKATTDAERDSSAQRVEHAVLDLLACTDILTADLGKLPIARVDAPDGKFRCFSWNIAYADGTHAYRGAMVVSHEGRNSVHRLNDGASAVRGDAQAKRNGPENWYGALYYAVVPCVVGKSKYYTLLGWRGVDGLETRKVIEVLSFNGPTPVFGAPLFQEGRTRHFRKIYAYSALSTMSLQWEPENKAILLDHLSPERPDLKGIPAFTVPDLSFDAYVWYKEKWHYMRDVDTRARSTKAPPVKPVEKGLGP